MAARGGERQPFYVTHRLINLADEMWSQFDGWCASRGVDPMELRMDRMVSLIYHWATKDAQDQASIDKWRSKLWVPPPHMKDKELPTESPWSAEAQMSAFGAFKVEYSGQQAVTPTTGG